VWRRWRTRDGDSWRAGRKTERDFNCGDKRQQGNESRSLRGLHVLLAGMRQGSRPRLHIDQSVAHAIHGRLVSEGPHRRGVRGDGET
jgi:hypothetical protein